MKVGYIIEFLCFVRGNIILFKLILSFFKFKKKGLIELTLTTPLQDEGVHQVPLEIISDLLTEIDVSNLCSLPFKYFESKFFFSKENKI